jgi:hypothetical protein
MLTPVRQGEFQGFEYVQQGLQLPQMKMLAWTA